MAPGSNLTETVQPSRSSMCVCVCVLASDVMGGGLYNINPQQVQTHTYSDTVWE